MRTRIVLSIIAILVMAAFVALNWPEFVRPVPLNFGAGLVEAPLGLLLLGALVILGVGFMASAAYMHTFYRLEYSRHSRELHAQRVLAENAETSRYTELRQFMEMQARDMHQRDANHAALLESALAQHERLIQARIDQMSTSLASYIGELDGRLPSRRAVVPH